MASRTTPSSATRRESNPRTVTPGLRTPVTAQSNGVPWTLVLACASAFLYLLLLLVVRRNPNSERDLNATVKLQSRNHPVLARFMTFVSWFGFAPQSLLFPLAALGAFWKLGLRLEAFFLGLAWGSSGFSFLSKQIVRRPRPDHARIRIAIARLRDTSFPSGHVIHYLTFWGFFAYVLLSRARNRALRWVVVAIFGPLLALVGPSRIYLGHHWLSDVLGSVLLSTAYLSGLITVYRRIGRALPAPRSGAADGSWIAGAEQWLR
jgi:membrane-associated phospholipid phosphatase